MHSVEFFIAECVYFRSGVEVVYALSYLHYSTLAVIISIIVGLIVSAISGNIL